MLKSLVSSLIVPALLGSWAPAHADDRTPQRVGQTGTVSLREANAVLDLPPGYRYLDRAEAAHRLSEWRLPMEGTVVGLVVAVDATPRRGRPRPILVSYYPGGSRDSHDLADEYNSLLCLQGLAFRLRAQNEIGSSIGYRPLVLVGPKEPPRFESTDHSLHWAVLLGHAGQRPHTIRYEIAILGPSGVLVLDTDAPVGASGARAEIERIAAHLAFTEGHRFHQDGDAADGGE